MIVHGKGDKDRTVYLTAKCMIAIQNYLNEREDDIDWLFPGGLGLDEDPSHGTRKARKGWYKHAELLKDKPINTSSIEATVRKIGKRAGVPNTHPHRFRRTCATMALHRGMPIEQVSKMLGHEQITTTQIYLDLSEKDLELAHRKYVT